jgi:hypothetical protein
VTHEVLSTVKFGALEMPSDAEIIFGHLDLHRSVALSPTMTPSPFESEMAAAVAQKPLTSAALQAATSGDRDLDDDLDVCSSCTCTSFNLPSHRMPLLVPHLCSTPVWRLCLLRPFLAFCHPSASAFLQNIVRTSKRCQTVGLQRRR